MSVIITVIISMSMTNPTTK